MHSSVLIKLLKQPHRYSSNCPSLTSRWLLSAGLNTFFNTCYSMHPYMWGEYFWPSIVPRFLSSSCLYKLTTQVWNSLLLQPVTTPRSPNVYGFGLKYAPRRIRSAVYTLEAAAQNFLATFCWIGPTASNQCLQAPNKPPSCYILKRKGLYYMSGTDMCMIYASV